MRPSARLRLSSRPHCRSLWQAWLIGRCPDCRSSNAFVIYRSVRPGVRASRSRTLSFNVGIPRPEMPPNVMPLNRGGQTTLSNP